MAAKKAHKNQLARIAFQKELGESIAEWAGIQKAMHLTDRMINKKFYLTFEMTITQALSEPLAEMTTIKDDIDSDIRRNGWYKLGTLGR